MCPVTNPQQTQEGGKKSLGSVGQLPSCKKGPKDYQLEEQAKLLQMKEMVMHELRVALEVNRQLVSDLRARCKELYQENQNLLQAVRIKGGLNGFIPRS